MPYVIAVASRSCGQTDQNRRRLLASGPVVRGPTRTTSSSRRTPQRSTPSSDGFAGWKRDINPIACIVHGGSLRS